MPATAQVYPIQRFMPEDGLPHFTVYTTYQDSDGYLWVGTRDGLARYDGQLMSPFPVGFSADGNIIHQISAGPENSMLLATHDGTFQRATSSGAANRLLDKDTKTLLSDSSGCIWIASTTDITRLSPDGTHKTLALPIGSWNALAEDEQGVVWMGGEAGLFHWNQGELLPIKDFPLGNIVALLTQGKDMWILASGHLYRMRSGSLERLPLSSEGPRCLAVDRNNNLWVGTRDGALFAEIKENCEDMTFERFGPDQGLGHPLVHHIGEDREGNLWFSTEIGLYRLRWLAFRNYTSSQGLLDNTIWAINSDEKGRIWIGTQRGVSILGPDNSYSYITPADGLPAGAVRAIEPDGNGGFYLGTSAGLAHHYRGVNRLITENGGPWAPFIRTLAHDDQGRLWGGTDAGDVFFGHPHQRFQHLGKADGLPGNRVFVLAGQDDTMWLGTNDGLALWHEGHPLVTYTIDNGLPANWVFAVAPQEDGSLWVGTVAGLAHMKDGQVQVYLREQGLSNETCYFIYADEYQHLWVGTNMGVNRYDGTRFRSFTRSHGLPFDELNLGAFHRDASGRFWFGTYNGLASLDARYLHANLEPLTTQVTGLTVGDKVVATEAGLQLTHDQNQLKFRFHANYLTSSDTVRYRYQLQGSDDDWQISSEGQVRYSALGPGDYRFAVAARSEEKPWGEPVRIQIHIAKPFWQTWPFGLLSLASLVGLVYLLMRDLRQRNLLLRRKTRDLGMEVARERATKLDREAELHLLHSQMNPHFLQNALNNAIYFSKFSPEKTERILTLLSRLLRHAFNTTLVGETSLEAELKLVSSYLEIQALRFGERLRFKVDVDDEDQQLTIPCFMIQPLVENAVVHGFKEVFGELDVHCLCQREGSILNITVSNNGRPSSAHLSDWLGQEGALKNIDTRLRLLYDLGLKYTYADGRHHFHLQFLFDT